MVLTPDVIGLIAFFAIIGILLVLNRKKIEFRNGMAIWRWRRGRNSMDRWIFSHRKFLEAFGTVGVAVGFIIPAIVVVAIVGAIFQGQQGAALILPTAGGFEYPTSAILGVPFWFWLVSIFVVLTVHEPMHAIFSRLAGVPVKSWGIMTFLVVPLGAFVDPDERKISRLKVMQKLKIFAGGSFGNFLTAGVFLLLIIAAGMTMFQLDVVQTTPGTPAGEAGIEGTLVAVGGSEIRNVGDLSAVLDRTPPGSEVTVITDRGEYKVTTISDPSGGPGSYLGVSLQSALRPQYAEHSAVVFTLLQLFRWLFIFNMGVGAINMLPIRPLDGGHVYYTLLQKLFKDDRKANYGISVLSVIFISIVLMSILGGNFGGLLP